MLTAIPILAILAAPPVSDDIRAPNEPVEVEVIQGPDSTHVLAYDAAGEVAAELVIWSSEPGEIRFDATYPDGLYMSAVANSDGYTVDTEDAAEVGRRVKELESVMAQLDPQASVGGCAFHVVGTTLSIIAVHPWAVAEAIVAACECLPLIVDEWEGYHCPGFG